MSLRSSIGTVLLACLSASIWVGCAAEAPDYSGTQFACGDGVCPDGFTCLESVCVKDDAVPPDASLEPDASAPDAALPDATPAATCDDMFSTAPGYELCSEDEDSCSFNVALEGKNCGAACKTLGSTCIGAIDNNEEPCVGIPETGDDCTTVRQSNICICARIALESGL